MRALASLLFCGSVGLLGCSSPAEVSSSANEDLDVRAPSPEKPYDVTTTLSITLTGADAALTGEAKTEKMQELARAEIDAVTRALDAELVRAWPDASSLVAVLRTTAPRRSAFHADPTSTATWTFGYWAQVASAITPPSTTELAIGGARIELAWAPAATAADAYPRYGDLFADGLDIAVAGDDGTLEAALATLPSRILVGESGVDVRVRFVGSFAAAAAADIVVHRGRSAPSTDAVTLPRKAQLFVFDGADSYTAGADAVLALSGDDDVVTTDDAAAFIEALVGGGGRPWTPSSWTKLLGESDGGRRVHLLHGITDGPKISMLADATKIGAACRANDDCGAADSLCIAGVCGAACADDSGCPEGKSCAAVSSRALGSIRQCL